MKTAVFLILFTALPAFAGTQAQTKCQSLDSLTVAPDIHEVCTYPDGSGDEIMTIDGDYTDTHYAAKAWSGRLSQLLRADAESARKQAAFLEGFAARENAADKIKNRKACKRAGDQWIMGSWMSPGYCTTKEAK